MAAVAAAKPAPAAAAANAPFVAAKKFGGKKAGYVFKKGAQGVGYYADVNKPVPTIGKEATPLEARQMVVMASRITPPPQPQPLDRRLGGPSMMAPRGIFAPRAEYFAGFLRNSTISVSSSLEPSQPATSSNVTPVFGSIWICDLDFPIAPGPPMPPPGPPM